MLRNCYPHSRLLLLLPLAVWLFCSLAYSVEQFPYRGMVTGDSVNVRAGSSVNHKILCKLHAGDEVVVRGERGGWLKIVPPSAVKAWIWSEFVKDGVVLRDSVNVRSQPDLRSSVMCQVDKGYTVQPLEQEGEWLAIAPPSNCYAWVSARYVQFSAQLPPAVEDKAEELFKRLEVRRTAFKPSDKGAEKELEELIVGYTRVMADAPNTRAARTSRDRIEGLENMQKRMAKARARKPVPTPEKKLPARKKADKRCVAEGVIQRAEGASGGTTHQLVGKRFFAKKVMCYLRASRMDLDPYVGKKVIITGTLVDGGTGKVPVVEVEDILLN